MRLLLDANLSPRVARLLRAEGFDAVHLRELGMQREADPVVLQTAVNERRILVSEDTDFGALLARSGATMPSRSCSCGLATRSLPKTTRGCLVGT